MAPPRVLILSSDSVLAARLGRLMRGLGRPAATIADEAAAADREGTEAVLADWAAVAEDPKAAIKRLSRRGRRVLLLLAQDEFFGPVLSKALSCGACDVVSTASSDADLAGRIAAVLGETLAPEEVLVSPAKDLRVDRARRRVSRRRGRGWVEAGPFSPREFDLLCFFLEHPGEDLARATLLERVWGDKADEVNPETVDRHVGSLRRRLGSAGDIRTLRSVGYRFA